MSQMPQDSDLDFSQDDLEQNKTGVLTHRQLTVLDNRFWQSNTPLVQ